MDESLWIPPQQAEKGRRSSAADAVPASTPGRRGAAVILSKLETLGAALGSIFCQAELKPETSAHITPAELSVM